MAGICDDRQTFCFALALWNGVDPILKERMFGLGGDGGNHGEDVKEYWWYLDSTPTHSWMRWRYHYPQRAFPYDELVARQRAARGRDEPEYELVDTGVFDDDRYWAVDRRLRQGRARPTCACGSPSPTAAPEPATLHVLPTLWFRNTWSWGLPGRDHVPGDPRRRQPRWSAEHRVLGQLVLAGDGAPTPLFCDNETNARAAVGPAGPRRRTRRTASTTTSCTARDTVNPDGVGTKAALHYVLDVPAGRSTARSGCGWR